MDLKNYSMAGLESLKTDIDKEMVRRKENIQCSIDTLIASVRYVYENTNTIRAIKTFRELTDLDLRTAKLTVEAWAKSQDWVNRIE